jgi:O-antigen/teichoic acid export membrane protein
MSTIRRAFFFASAERYIVIAISFALVPIIARLMDPAEFGISVLGMAALAIAEVIRDFGGGAYIIQEKQLTMARIRTAFTITLMWTLILTVTLFLAAGPLARFYEVPGLKFYLRIVAISYLIGPFVAPLFALMQREMAFDKIAIITIITTTTNAALTVIFAVLGYSYLSFAMANVGSASCGMLLGFYFRPQFSVFRISFADWRILYNFGRYQMGVGMLSCLWNYLPYLVIGRMLDNTAIGLYQRAVTVSTLPLKAVSAIDYVAFPAISAHLREGGDIKQPYLRALVLITGVHWPGLLVLALLAHPLVVVLLGQHWLAVAPLIFVMALARLFGFASSLSASCLLAAGRPRQLFLLQAVLVPVSIGAVALSAPHGINAVAWTMFLTTPLELTLCLYFIRQLASFTFAELVAALRPSAVVTLFSALGPFFVIVLHGWGAALPLATLASALLLSGLGWTAGLWITGHPLFGEIQRAMAAGLKHLPGRLRAATPAAPYRPRNSP